MSFFKRLFQSRKTETTAPGAIPHIADSFRGIVSQETMDQRLTPIDEKEQAMIEGSHKMLHSFFIERSIDPNKAIPVNHPENLDLAVESGYLDFCRHYGQEDFMCLMQMALLYTDYMVSHQNMKAYSDSQPEYELRGLRIQKTYPGNRILSLYPIEYSHKVLSGEKTYRQMLMQITTQESQLPELNEELKKFSL